MADNLIVILGAGASHDCIAAPASAIQSSHLRLNASKSYRPPLTKDLFDLPFRDILHRYPRAEAAAVDIRLHAAQGAIGLEGYLRNELRDAKFPPRRARYVEVPLYLQELLWQLSELLASQHPENYDRLTNALLDLDRVAIVTLNYDTILDDRLFAQWRPPRAMSDYIAPGRKWSLIKPHGSVNWVRRILMPPPPHAGPLTEANAFYALGEQLAHNLSDTVELVIRGARSPYEHWDELRFSREQNQLGYPAISVPLGPDDTFACPDDHLEHLGRHIESLEALHLLVIGYSGLDNQILERLAQARKLVASLMIVTDNADSLEATRARFVAKLGQPRWNEAATGGFNEWSQAGSFDLYFREWLPGLQ